MRLDTLGTLLDIEDAAKYIIDDTAKVSYQGFLSDRRLRQAVERNFINIGEAINRLRRRDPETVLRISRVPEIVGMRNILTHGYDEVKYDRVWRTIKEHLPLLLEEIQTLLEEGERDLADRHDH
jgi:uncharacterized protein with HEPN domain